MQQILVTWHGRWKKSPVNYREKYVFQANNLDFWHMALTFEHIQDILNVNPATKF